MTPRAEISHEKRRVIARVARRATADRVESEPLLRDVFRGEISARTRVSSFRSLVWGYWKKEGRDLPWRKTRDPYKILVSEVMLQQTQVARVIDTYVEFLRAFPTVRALSQASLVDILRVWSGLGYNRRAKFLHDAAREVVLKRKGIFPLSYEDWRALPGIGDYTAKAVRVFAFNQPEVLIETNVRTVFIHYFFPHKKNIEDAQLLPLIEKALVGQDPRGWYSALMDFGAHLKQLYPNPSRRSKHHVKQSKFKGSVRQVRGAILRALAAGPSVRFDSESLLSLLSLSSQDKKRLEDALDSLLKDGLIRQRGSRWVIS